MKNRSAWISFLLEGRRACRGPALAMLLLCRTADAHVGDRVFPIYELPSSDLPDLHDGTLEDWEQALPGASLDYHDFRDMAIGDHDGGLVDPSVIAFDVYLAWHYASQRIFVGVNRFDGVYTFRLPPEPPPVQMHYPMSSDACCRHYDHVDLTIDGDHGGEPCATIWFPRLHELEEAKITANRKCQRYTAVPEAEGSRRIGAQTVGPAWAFESPYTDAGGFRWGESPSLSGYEIAVTPWDWLDDDPSGSVRSTLEPEKVVGLCISIWDIDEIEFPKWKGNDPFPVRWYASGGCNPGLNSRSADALLVPCAVGDCSQASSSASSSVRRDSWGRIKASVAR